MFIIMGSREVAGRFVAQRVANAQAWTVSGFVLHHRKEQKTCNLESPRSPCGAVISKELGSRKKSTL